eukprot:Sdes_comp20821_c0_seq2m17298
MVGRKAQDKSIILWDLGSGKSLKSFKGHSEAITSLDFSGEGSVLASGALDCSVRIWDTKTCLSNLKEGASSIDSNEASLNLVSSKSGYFFVIFLFVHRKICPHRVLFKAVWETKTMH